MDRPGGLPSRLPVWVAPRPTIAQFLRQCLSEFREIVWPNGRTVRTNAIVALLTVIILIVGLGALELAVGNLAAGLFS